MWFGVAVEEVEEKNRCQIVGLVKGLESGARIGKMEPETVLEIRTHCVWGASGRVLSNRIHCASAELEKERETHSHVFEEKVCCRYYRERS